MDFAVPAEHQQAPHNATHNVDHALPPVMAAIPDALEGMQLAQDFTGSAQQLQADMDALRLSLETLDFGGVDAIPDAMNLTQQDVHIQHTEHPGSHTDQQQQPFTGPTGASQGLGNPSTDPDDLSAFLSGLRSKYQLSTRSAANVADDALNKEFDGKDNQTQHASWSILPSHHQREDPDVPVQDLVPLAEQEWKALNQQLRNSGFSGMELADAAQQRLGISMPSPRQLLGAFSTVLQQYDRRAQLVQELLAATDLARQREAKIDAMLSQLCRERDEAVRAATAARDLSERSAENAQRKHSKNSSVLKRLEADVGKLSGQVVALEHANRLKEQQLQEAQASMGMSDKSRQAAERATEVACQTKRKMESEIARLQRLASELEHSKRAKEAETAALAETASQSSRGEQEAQKVAAKAQASSQRLEVDILRLQRHITQLEQASKLQEQELQQVQRGWSAASQQEGSHSQEAQRAKQQVKALEGQLRDLHSRLTTLQADARAKDAEAAQLASGMQLSQAEQAAARKAAQHMQARLEAELARLQAQLRELSQVNREKEQAIEHWMDAASMSSKEAGAADSEARRAQDSTQRLEAEVKRLSTSLAELALAYRQKEAEVHSHVESASQSDLGLESAQHDSNYLRERAKGLESELGQLQAHIVQCEHVARAHEMTVEKLKGALRDKVNREERVSKRDAEAYSRLKRAFVSSKGEGGQRGQAGAVVAAARELRPVEIVGLYEGQKEQLEGELVMLRAEVLVLAAQLKDAENRCSAQAEPRILGTQSDEALSHRLSQVESSAADAQRALHIANQSAAEAAREAARREAQAEHKADVLAEENASLILELDARPTAKQYKSLQRQMDILERRLSDAKHAQELGEAAEQGELELGSKVLGNAPLSTRERIRRDRELHRLGLHLVEKIPKDVLVDLVQDVCITMEVSDPMGLPVALHKVLHVLSSLPRLERFVADVCEAVYHQGHAFVPDAYARQEPSAVPAVLKAWSQALQGLHQAHRTQAALVDIINTRAASGSEAQVSVAELIPAVRQLVEHERNSLAAADTIAAAQQTVASQPEVLLHRIVAHFQHLFACPHLEGVLPALNQMYVAYTEGMNFRKSLADLLGLEAGAGIAACLQRIRQLLDRHGQALDLQDDYMASMRDDNKENAHQQSSSSKDNWPEVEIRVASKPSGVSRKAKLPADQPKVDGKGLQDGLAEPEIAKHVSITSKLADLLGVANADQVIAQAEKIVTRLQRLDEVMPKYQQVMSQLYDLLRVRGLEEVVPAVQHLLT